MTCAPCTHIDDRTPRVTVFIPAFNVERYIAESIESVLAQTYRDFELLVVDDGSTDRTLETLRSYEHDPRVRIIANSTNLGRPATRNIGLDLARGELIAFLDGDDICLPERLQHQVDYLDAHPGITGVGTWMTLIDENSNSSGDIFYEEALDADQVACEMLVGCSIAQGSMMVRKSAITAFRYNEAFPVAQDYELWARMMRTCKFTNIALALTQYRIHSSQATTARSIEQRALVRQVYGHQAAALGITYTDLDLARHECLFRLEGRKPVREKTGAPLDIDYLRWARSWLEAIIENNSRRGIYPEPALSLMVAPRWLFACSKAARNSSWKLVATELLSSKALLKAIGLHAWHKITRMA